MMKVELFTEQTVSIEKLELQLEDVEVQSISAIDTRLFGENVKSQTTYEGVTRASSYTMKTKIEIIVPQKNQSQLIHAIKEVLGAARCKNSKIFTSPMNDITPLFEQ